MAAKRVLVACEFSGRVREAFRNRGFEAWSCDILPSEDNSIHHLQEDVLEILRRSDLCGGVFQWDLMIAHPPCTYLCNSGVCWLHFGTGKRTKKNYTAQQCEERWKGLEKAIAFFLALRGANIPHIAIENPIPHKFAKDGWIDFNLKTRVHGIGKYTQIIQPWQFGHPETKATCLWLKNLPKLEPTNKVSVSTDRKKRMRLHYLPPSKDRWKQRSITYRGIADAMAKQWGDYIEQAS